MTSSALTRGLPHPLPAGISREHKRNMGSQEASLGCQDGQDAQDARMIRMSGCLAQDPGVKYGQQNHPEGMVLSGHVMTGRYHRARLGPSSSRERPLRLALATLESNSLARTVVFGIKKKFFF